MTIQEYWRFVRQTEQEIIDQPNVDPNSVYVLAVESMGRPLPEGSFHVTAVTALSAARLILAKTHRLATDEEVARYHEDEKRRAGEIRGNTLRASTEALFPGS